MNYADIAGPLLVLLIAGITGAIYTGLKAYFNYMRDLERIKQRVAELPCTKHGEMMDNLSRSLETISKNESKQRELMTLIVSGLIALCDGQIQQGCNGPVKECKQHLETFLIKERRG